MSELFIKRELGWRNALLKLFIELYEDIDHAFYLARQGHNGWDKVQKKMDRIVDSYDLEAIKEFVQRRKRHAKAKG
jgi:hypothetical protein